MEVASIWRATVGPIFVGGVCSVLKEHLNATITCGLVQLQDRSFSSMLTTVIVVVLSYLVFNVALHITFCETCCFQSVLLLIGLLYNSIITLFTPTTVAFVICQDIVSQDARRFTPLKHMIVNDVSMIT